MADDKKPLTFDDLAPAAKKPGAVTFDDLVPKQDPNANPLRGVGEKMLAPVGNAARLIAQESGAGGKEMWEGAKEAFAAQQKGDLPGVVKGAYDVGGGALRTAGAPVVGGVKGLVTDPLRNVVGENAVSSALDKAAELLGPGMGGKVAKGTVEAGNAALKSAGWVADKVLPEFQPAVQILLKNGVDLTPDQIAQGAFKRGADAMASAPVVGSAVRSGQRRAVESFNIATLNGALNQVGEALPKSVKAGREAIGKAADILGSRFNDLIKQLKPVEATPSFITGMASVPAEAQAWGALPETVQRLQNVRKTVEDSFVSGAAPSGNFAVSPQHFKQLESKLSAVVKEAWKDNDYAFANGVQAMQDHLRGALADSNPAHAAELHDLNTAWAIFKRAEGAAARRVASGGVFMPSDLSADIKKHSSQGAFARAATKLQAFADAGQKVLPSTIADSGTAERNAWLGLLGGSGFLGSAPAVLGGGALGAAHFNPLVAAGVGAATAPYTKPAMRALSEWARKRPSTAANLVDDLAGKMNP